MITVIKVNIIDLLSCLSPSPLSFFPSVRAALAGARSGDLHEGRRRGALRRPHGALRAAPDGGEAGQHHGGAARKVSHDETIWII